jgi:putative spermidine/putrescine transport system permease protein
VDHPQQVKIPRAVRLRLALGLIPAAVVLTAVYLVPLAWVVAESVSVDGRASLGHYQRLFGTSAFITIVRRTLVTSASVTALCLALGYPLAYTIGRLPARYARVLLFVVAVPFFTSLLVRTYAWVVILGNNGLINRALLDLGLIATPLPLVYNDFGTLVGMVQIQLPLMILPLYSVMSRIDRSLVRAGQTLGASPASAFLHIVWPLSKPGVLAGCSLVFVTTLGFFVTPALLGGPGQYLLAQSIEARVSSASDFGLAAAEATMLLVLVAGLMLLLRGPLAESLDAHERREVRAAISLTRGAFESPALRRAARRCGDLVSAIRWPSLAAVSGLVLTYLVLPMMVIIPLAFSSADFLSFPPPGYSVRWFASYLGNPAWMTATWFSLGIATTSALLATALGLLAALPLVRVRLRGAPFIYLACVSPLIVPHMVIAVSLFFLLARAGLIGHPASFVATYTVFGLPYAVIILTANLRRFDVSLEQAAASLGAAPWRILAHVTVPLLWPAIASAFLLAFLSGFDDIVAALFLSAPNAVTLPIRMWEDVRAEISPRIAAVGSLFFATALVAFLLPPLVGQVRRRLRARG